MKKAPVIKLIPLDCSYLELINHQRHNEELLSNLGGSFRYTPIQKDEAWYKHLCEDEKQERAMIAYPVARATETSILYQGRHVELCGMASLTSIDPIHRSAEFHIQLYSHKGLGIGTQACRATLKHGFEDLNLNRIFLHVQERNEIAIKTYLRNGFQIEGVLRERTYKEGKYHNCFVMSILKNEWELKKENA